MRRTLAALAAAGLLATVNAPARAADAPPPSSCLAAIEGAATPADPGGLLATASVVTFAVEIVCVRDPLRTPPIELAEPYTGHLTTGVFAQDGSHVCAPIDPTGGVFQSAGPVLVMAVTGTCVLPVSDPRRTQPMHVRAYWATMPPYRCCEVRFVPISPVGAST